ncbi:hypothetical protein WMO27_04370 [Lachnospiraceae bacterium CLA-AA-H183]|jgi:L-cysteine desulfidase
MKKQDKESLIREVTKRLDWYTMEASDEEFDADEVQTLLKLLDSLKGEEKEEELPVEEALDSFWKYCEKRQEEERILAADGKESEENRKTEPEKKEGRMHQFLWYFHKHRIAVVTAVALIIIMLGGSWQMAVNAEKHGGFFWWMDKNEEGTTMITAPEESDIKISDIYDKVEDVPEEYKEYALIPFELSGFIGGDYNLSRIEVIKSNKVDSIYDYFENEKEEILYFEIKRYRQEILRVRETYPGYVFCEEFENDGINLEVFQKEEESGKQRYVIYFYYRNEKYAVVGVDSKEKLKEIAVEYLQAVISN